MKKIRIHHDGDAFIQCDDQGEYHVTLEGGDLPARVRLTARRSSPARDLLARTVLKERIRTLKLQTAGVPVKGMVVSQGIWMPNEVHLKVQVDETVVNLVVSPHLDEDVCTVYMPAGSPKFMTDEQLKVCADKAVTWLIATHLPEMEKYTVRFTAQEPVSTPSTEMVPARKLDEGDEIHLPVGARVLRMPKGQMKRPGLASSQRAVLRRESVGTLTSWSLFDREMELTVQTDDGTRLISEVGFDQLVTRTRRS